MKCRMMGARLAVAVAGALTLACSKPAAPPKAPAPAKVENPIAEAALTSVVLTEASLRALRVETVIAEVSVFAAVRNAGGEVTVPPGANVSVTAPFAGVVLAPEQGAIPGAGSHVTARQPLMRIVPVPADRNVTRSTQEVVQSEARLREADAELKRVTDLYADRLVSARDLEKAQTVATSARADVEAARAQLELSKGNVSGNIAALSAMLIAAPRAGVVQNVPVAAGQLVSAGTLLAEVVDLDKLWIRVPVYAGDVSLFERGASASVQRLGSGAQQFLANARPVSAPLKGDTASASIDLFFEIAAPAGGSQVLLRPGERVSVGLKLAGVGSSAIALPVSALVYDMNGGSWVYEQADSLKFTRRRVAVARVVDGKAVVTSGITTGMKIVTVGAAELFGSEFGIGK